MDKERIITLANQYVKFEKDPAFREEVEKLLAEQKYDELNERFYKELDFGTGGIRGILGGGYNRLNTFIIRKTTQGLANYIRDRDAAAGASNNTSNSSVVIAYDSRNYSSVFALETALVLCANNIKTYLFTSLRPTPTLSFAVRHLGCTAGVVITASHNPAEYNGYKLAWSDGGQVVPPHDELIIEEVRKSQPGDIKSMDEKTAIEKKLLIYIDEQVDKPYLEMVKNCFLRPTLVKEKGNTLKVVYTPLNGAGKIFIEKALKEAGIEVITVPEQAEPDGNFPTLKFPNPEEASAMELAINLAKKNKADIVMGTDPDSDRIGIAVPDADGKEYVLISGNQLGSMLVYYMLTTLNEHKKLPQNGATIKTIVTTELQRLIGESFGVKVYDVLTGFKWIASLIANFEKTGENYIFGTEESYGFLVNQEVRDKDAVSAAIVTAEMALYCRAKGMSLLDYLNSIYEKYGYFKDTQISGVFKGQKGVETMKTLMSNLRVKPFEKLGELKISAVRDYEKNISLNGITLPQSDVLQFILEDGSMVTVRPSGTEPKIKFYISCRDAAGKKLQETKSIVDKKVDLITQDIKFVLDSQHL
ncbi:MAG: phospho-sugar mutase [Spirochaetes bacterium]|nr:phospho-sugar mutase [Spirochaetota bacterium]